MYTSVMKFSVGIFDSAGKCSNCWFAVCGSAENGSRQRIKEGVTACIIGTKECISSGVEKTQMFL